MTFNVSTQRVLCNFSKLAQPDILKHCSVNVTYGAECNQLVNTHSQTSTATAIALDFELINGVSEYCLSVNATIDNKTVIVDEITFFINIQNGNIRIYII